VRNGSTLPSAIRQAYQAATSDCAMAGAFDRTWDDPFRGDAMEQPPDQVLDAAGTEFCQRDFDRPLTAQNGVAGEQTNPGVVNAALHVLCGGHHACQALDPLNVLQLQALPPSVNRR
jgi:hypothetical protein